MIMKKLDVLDVMENKTGKSRKILAVMSFFVIGLLMSTTFAYAYSVSSPQYSQFQSPDVMGLGSKSSLEFDDEMCRQGQDFFVQIPPFGCEPAVVRTDLLEEQNVPVYCQLAATKVNPLIDVEAIDTISFPEKEYPPEIQGIGFLPARAALGTEDDVNTPVMNNIGYVQIVLKKQEDSSKMPDYVEGNLTAKLTYDVKNAFGVGQSTFYLPKLSDDDWQEDMKKYSFWEGRGYLRAEDIEGQKALVSVYDGEGDKVDSVSISEGATSRKINLPGFNCFAKMELKLHELMSPGTKAKLKINDDFAELAEGDKFLDDKCWVTDLEKIGLLQKVSIKCREDNQESKSLFASEFTMFISPKVRLKVGSVEGEYSVGDLIFKDHTAQDKDDWRNYYLGYAGSDTGQLEDLRVVVIGLLNKDYPDEKLEDDDLVSVTNMVKAYTISKEEGLSPLDIMKEVGEFYWGGISNLWNYLVNGEATDELTLDNPKKTIGKVDMTLLGAAEPIDQPFATDITSQKVLKYYQNANRDYDYVLENFANEKIENSEETYGERALYEKLLLAYYMSQMQTTAQLCEDFKKEYPDAKKSLVMCNDLTLSNQEAATALVFVNGKSRRIVFEGVSEPSLDEFSAEISIESPDGSKDKVTLQKNEKVYLDKFIGKDGDTFALNPLYSREVVINEKLINALGQQLPGTVYFRHTPTQGWRWTSDYEKALLPVANKGESNKDYNPGKYKEILDELEKIENDATIAKGDKFERGKVVIWDNGNVRAEFIQLIDLENTQARIKAYLRPKEITDFEDFLEFAKQNKFTYVETIDLKKPDALASNFYFTLEKVNLKKNARVSVIPEINEVGSETNFSFRIGIEQRTIQLSTGETKKRIKNLDETIEEWEDISENLGEIVKTLKGACLAVGAWITIKNFFSGLGGKSIARQKVMRGDGGWHEICSNYVSEGTYSSLDQCYKEKADEIEKSVEVAYNIQQKQQEDIKKDQKSNTKSGGVFSESVINTEGYMEDAVPRASSVVKDSTWKNASELSEKLDYNAWKTQKPFNTEDLRDAEYWAKVYDNPDSPPELKAMADKRLTSLHTEIDSAYGNYESKQTFSDKYGFPEPNIGQSQKVTEIGFSDDVKWGSVKNNFAMTPLGWDDNTKVQSFKDTATGKEYLLKLDDDNVIQQTYEITETSGKANLKSIGVNEEKILVDKNPLKLSFKQYDKGTYENTFKNPELKYYETEPYKGLPAIIPFDLDNGWYAATKQTLPVGANIQAFDKSGRVTSFYLCNVGRNGLQEFNSGLGDDECQMVNTGTGQAYNQFPGLSETESRSLISKAIRAVEEASKKYESGLSGDVSILGEVMKVGAPAANIPDMQCQDIMSPKDCLLMFNVCDPVICPSSRCDFGGSFPVDNVIQSGIIGGIFLCLPNFKEGIYVPVCLTGIKAGIDGLVSVLKNHRDCLQENLETGKMIGICDELYSFYLCDLLWKQALPLAEVAIPKLLGVVFGQGSRGGGEYLGVKSAWDNAKQSLDYFTSSYAVNSFNAFKARSLGEVGEEICKSQVSGTFPGMDFLDTFTEPDSPVQFHGRFEEKTFSTATSPPTSQYKVFYHIYAGEDSGVYYQVYLKSKPGSTYYKDLSSTYTVAQGYSPAGEYASETRDFTAPSGYKELCINVNGQEECGFQEVSTSFALNYVSEKYKQEQLTETDIDSESACISGTASPYSLLTLSAEEAASGLIDPAIYNQGITRICSTSNPGQGTDPERWKEVGNCGDAKVKCWLDTSNIDDIIKNENIKDETLSTIESNLIKVAKDEGRYVIDFEGEMRRIVLMADSMEKIEEIGVLYDRVFLNNEKVQLLLERANAYGALASEEFSLIPSVGTTQLVDKAIGDIAEAVEGAVAESETENVITAQSCEDCGGGALDFDFCEEHECEAISEILGEECTYIHSRLKPGGFCYSHVQSITSAGALSDVKDFLGRGLTVSVDLGREITYDDLNAMNVPDSFEGTLLLDGNVRANIGEYLEKGSIQVNGVLYGTAGTGMEDGTIQINGNVENTVGLRMESGSIKVNGDVSKHVGPFMKGGTITVTGNVLGSAGTQMSGGTITVQGKVEGDVYKDVESGTSGEISIVGDNVYYNQDSPKGIALDTLPARVNFLLDEEGENGIKYTLKELQQTEVYASLYNGKTRKMLVGKGATTGYLWVCSDEVNELYDKWKLTPLTGDEFGYVSTLVLEEKEISLAETEADISFEVELTLLCQREKISE